MSSQQQGYVPGVCNIGRAEIRQRQVLGWTALVLGVALCAALVLFRAAPAWRLTVFVPATVSAIGFLQAARGFCAKYGLLGAFNLGETVGRTDTVEQAEFRRRDRRTAIEIIGWSLALGCAAAGAAYLTPL